MTTTDDGTDDGRTDDDDGRTVQTDGRTVRMDDDDGTDDMMDGRQLTKLLTMTTSKYDGLRYGTTADGRSVGRLLDGRSRRGTGRDDGLDRTVDGRDSLDGRSMVDSNGQHGRRDGRYDDGSLVWYGRTV